MKVGKWLKKNWKIPNGGKNQARKLKWSKKSDKKLEKFIKKKSL